MRRILLAAVLTSSLLAASPTHLLDPLLSFLFSLWTAPSDLDAGCGADPDGRCTTPSQPGPDAGCGADPSGWCNPGS